MDTGNYRKRILHKLAKDLEVPKLTFQVIRHTIATLAQKKGTVKDVQGVLRHSRAATTADVYMQEIPKSVPATVNSINAELRKRPAPCPQGRRAMQKSAMTVSEVGRRSNALTPNDTNPENAVAVSC